MKDNISPEEKLLRLIRGQKRQGGMPIDKGAVAVPSGPAPKATAKLPVFFSIHNFLYLNLKKIILVFFVLSCFYLAISFLNPWFSSKAIDSLELMPEKYSQPQAEPKLDIKPYDFYADVIAGRQIFASRVLQEALQAGASVNVDLAKDINLIGIISGDNPQAIIEDKKIQKTYYLNKGQFIGEYQLEEILEGKIILDYKGQRFELYL